MRHAALGRPPEKEPRPQQTAGNPVRATACLERAHADSPRTHTAGISADNSGNFSDVTHARTLDTVPKSPQPLVPFVLKNGTLSTRNLLEGRSCFIHLHKAPTYGRLFSA